MPAIASDHRDVTIRRQRGGPNAEAVPSRRPGCSDRRRGACGSRDVRGAARLVAGRQRPALVDPGRLHVGPDAAVRLGRRRGSRRASSCSARCPALAKYEGKLGRPEGAGGVPRPLLPAAPGRQLPDAVRQPAADARRSPTTRPAAMVQASLGGHGRADAAGVVHPARGARAAGRSARRRPTRSEPGAGAATGRTSTTCAGARRACSRPTPSARSRCWATTCGPRSTSTSCPRRYEDAFNADPHGHPLAEGARTSRATRCSSPSPTTAATGSRPTARCARAP